MNALNSNFILVSESFLLMIVYFYFIIIIIIIVNLIHNIST